MPDELFQKNIHFNINGTLVPALNMPCKASWHAAALKKGFDLLGRALDRYHGVIRCHTCKADSVVRLNVVRDHNPLCHHCIRSRRITTAEKINAVWIAQDQTDRHYGHYRLRCGHAVRSQYIRVDKAATGGHAVSCETCREVRYAAQAQKFDWTLEGPAVDGRRGYRSYRHVCGHRQDVHIGNMVWDDCECAQCGQGWSTKKSFIYLFQISLPGMTVLKLGYSARPEKRLRHQLGIDPKVPTDVLRVVEMSKGNRAVAEERACHRYMQKHHHDLIVPKEEFGDAINTKSEIYREDAADILNAMLDRIAEKHQSP